MDACPLSAEDVALLRAVLTASPADRDAVRLAQQQLADAGFDPGPADGVPGPRTSAALHAAELSAGLTPPAPPTTRLRIVSRDAHAGWGAAPYKGRPALLGPVKRVTIHHTAVAGKPPRTRAEGIAAVRGVQRIHQGQRWSDVGYHLLLAQDGTWYLGRALARSLPEATIADPAALLAANVWALGSHVGGQNTGNLGLSVMGYFHAPHGHQMTREAEDSLIAMVRLVRAAHPSAPVVGHRDLAATACPGDTLMPLVRTLPGYAGRGR